jgi:hypothetical protein
LSVLYRGRPNFHLLTKLRGGLLKFRLSSNLHKYGDV